MFKIIIVEDDKEIREELKILLQNSGYEVIAISEFENVANKILEEQAHLVLLDINLPNKNGFEICNKVRAKSKIPIIFVTSRNNSMDELNGIMLGGDDYIEKPYNVPILLARIQNLLNRTYSKQQESSSEESKIQLEQEDGNEDTHIYYFDFGYKLVATTKDSTNEKFYEGLKELVPVVDVPMTGEIDGKIQEYTMERALGGVETRGQRKSEVKSFYAIISFLAFYIALIFVMGAATLLAIQQLSDSEKYKYRYELLKKLGMDETQINRLILKQLFFYFAIPMVVPIIVSIPAILSIGSIFTVAVTTEEIFKNIGMILGILILVYGIYFIATDVQFDRNINGSR